MKRIFLIMAGIIGNTNLLGYNQTDLFNFINNVSNAVTNINTATSDIIVNCNGCDLSNIDFTNNIGQYLTPTQTGVLLDNFGIAESTSLDSIIRPLIHTELRTKTATYRVIIDFTGAKLQHIIWSSLGYSQSVTILAHLSNAHLDDATLTNITFQAPVIAKRSGGSRMDTPTDMLYLKGATLNGVTFAEYSLQLQAQGATFQDSTTLPCSLIGIYNKSDFTDATMKSNSLMTINSDLFYAVFRSTNLTNIVFGSTGTRTDLRNAIFDHSSLTNVHFGTTAASVGLTTTPLNPALLGGSSFYQTTMSTVGLEGVDLHGADLNITVPTLGNGSGITTNILFNTSTNFANTTASTDFAQWIAQNTDTGTMGDYMFAQCQAKAQGFCGAFCYMGADQKYKNATLDACHTILIDNPSATNNGVRCRQPVAASSLSSLQRWTHCGPSGCNIFAMAFHPSPEDAPCSPSTTEGTCNASNAEGTITCWYDFEQIEGGTYANESTPQVNYCNQTQCINTAWPQGT